MCLYIICCSECERVCIYLNQRWECERPQLKWAGHHSPTSRRQGLVICAPPTPPFSPSLPLSRAPLPHHHPASPASNWPGSTAGHAVLHGLDEVIISRPLTTSKINSFWNGHNGGLTRRDISIISSSPPLSSLSPLGTGRVWFIPGLMRGGDLGPRATGIPVQCSGAWSPQLSRRIDRKWIQINSRFDCRCFTVGWHLTWNLKWLVLSEKSQRGRNNMRLISKNPVPWWSVHHLQPWCSWALRTREDGKLSLGGTWTSCYQMLSPLHPTPLSLPPSFLASHACSLPSALSTPQMSGCFIFIGWGQCVMHSPPFLPAVKCPRTWSGQAPPR